jgi:hypothetical protein
MPSIRYPWVFGDLLLASFQCNPEIDGILEIALSMAIQNPGAEAKRCESGLKLWY